MWLMGAFMAINSYMYDVGKY